MIPDVAVPSYQDAFGSLGSVYDPQTSQVQSEITQLQPQQDAQQAGLDQAKVNAFRDITSAANAKGMLFSGFSPDQQAQYVGTKYLPAVANLKATFQNSRNTLLEKINAINANRSTQAQGIVSSAQSANTNNAYRNAQLALSQQRNNIAAGRAGAPKAMTKTQFTAYARQQLEANKGGDNHVSPQDLALAYRDWTGRGYDPKSFWTNFQGYWNPNQSNYNQAFHGAL